MGIFDADAPDATVLPRNYKAGFLDDWWYDESDRRYCLDGPNAVSEDVYETTRMHQEFMKALESNPNAAAPPGYDPMIEAEDREIARIRREEG